jgi:hypothetical protein
VQTDPSWRRTWRKASLCVACRDRQLAVQGHCSGVDLRQQQHSALGRSDRDLIADDGATLLTSAPFIKSVVLALLEMRQNTAVDIGTLVTVVDAASSSVTPAAPRGSDVSTTSPGSSANDVSVDEPLLKFPRTSHLLVAGRGQGVTRDDLVLEGADKAAYFHTQVIVQEKVTASCQHSSTYIDLVSICQTTYTAFTTSCVFNYV